MGDRMPCLSPVKTWSWYGFPDKTIASTSSDVWVKRTFSSFIPWMMSSRLGLESNSTNCQQLQKDKETHPELPGLLKVNKKVWQWEKWVWHQKKEMWLLRREARQYRERRVTWMGNVAMQLPTKVCVMLWVANGSFV